MWKIRLNFEHFWKCTPKMYTRAPPPPPQISKYATGAPNKLRISERVGWVCSTMRCTVWVKKIPPWGILTFFPKRLRIFRPNFAYLLYVPIYAGHQFFLSNYLQFWRSYAIFSETMQFTPHVQNVHHRPKHTLHFLTFFPNSWEFLVQILHTYYTFLFTLDCKFLSDYL